MQYTVYINKNGKWFAWSTENSYADAKREASFLVKYEGAETKVRPAKAGMVEEF